ncbi:MAG: hypothetical protein KIS66_05395 [Fimbriimonadaceae bacterium]|nr:hypothetical protein [Fimbriimonadaceae bacterium]
MTYSGGTWTSGGSSGSYAGTGPYGTVTPLFYPGPGSATCGGTITATFVWNDAGTGTEPPPALLLKETSVAEWYGDAGSCANGLGSPVVETEYPDNPGGTCEGTKWTIKELPGPSFTVTCSPAALMTLGSGSPNYGFCRVNYTAQVFAARLVLGGEVWKDGTTNKVAIGQKVTAQVVLDAGAPSPTSYAWTVSGGEPFADYVVTETLPNQNPQIHTAVYTPYQPGSTAATEFYFRTARDSASVECQVTLSGISGKMSLGAYVTSLAPTFHDRYAPWNIGRPELVSKGPPRAVVADGDAAVVNMIALFGAKRRFVTNANGGTDWDPTLGLLLGAALDDSACRNGGQMGTWTFVQQFIDNTTIVLEDGSPFPHPPVNDWPLDGYYPFKDIYVEPPGSGQRVTKNPSPGATYSSVTGQFTGVLVDNPNIAWTVAPGLLIPGDIRFENEFKTHMLYFAPGFSKPVPIRQWRWQVSGHATKSPPQLPSFPRGVWALPNASAAVTSQIPFPEHPLWTRAVTPPPAP